MNQFEMRQKAYQSTLTNRALQVLLYLIDRADKAQTCFPAVPTIGRELHISISTVKRAMKELISSGYVSRESRFRERNGGQTSNLYTLRFPEPESGEGERRGQVDMGSGDCEAALIGQKAEERLSGATYSDMASVERVPAVLGAVEKEDGSVDDVGTMGSAECIAGCDGAAGDEGTAVSEDGEADSMGIYGRGVCDNGDAEFEKQGNKGCCNMGMRKRNRRRLDMGRRDIMPFRCMWTGEGVMMIPP